MHAAADTTERTPNMILKYFRTFNAGVVAFIMGIRFRSIGAVVLSSFAGLSLTSNIIPSALSFAGVMDSFSARWEMGGFAVYSMLAWGVGGWAAQKTGGKLQGAVILGLVGLISGVVFTGFGVGTGVNHLLAGGVAALLYGSIGGMIIADALQDPDGSSGRIGDLGIFNYFKNQL